MHWCATSTKTLNAAIAGEKESIETLTEQIAGEEKHVAKLGKEIAALEKQIKELDQAAEEAKAQRKDGRDLYEKTESDFKGTIKAIGGAIKGLKESDGTFLAQKAATPQLHRALALAELVGVNDEQRSALASLLQKPEQLAAGDRAKHVKAYNFKSRNIIELLKELQRKFEDDLLVSTKAETNAENAYALEKQARDAANAAADKSKKEKTASLGEVKADLTQHKADLADTETELETDSATLAETQKACDQKTQEWEERSAVRSNEIAAMGTAIKILAKATGVRTEAPGNPVPPPAPASFLQMSDPKQKALNLLRSKARETHSRTLAKMAQQLAAHLGDPFKDVNNMIEKMIFHLQAEQTDEDKHKAWCDQEISKTNTSRENKEEKIAELTSKIDAAEATVQELTQDIADANEMIAKINEFVAESKEIREIGKKENAAALKDAQTAQTAVANAIAVLTDFYKESGMVEKEAWEFVQRGVDLPKNPDTWDSSYTGVSDPKKQPGGIIAILEEVAAKFAAMEADTKAQEATDQKEYAQQMSESKIEKATRAKEAEMKEQEKKRLVDKLESLKKTRKHLSGELEAVNQYYEDLKPACMDGDSSYEERKAARDKEIEALRQAEDILAKAFDDKSAFVAIRRHS